MARPASASSRTHRAEILEARRAAEGLARVPRSRAVAHFDVQGSTRHMIRDPSGAITYMPSHNGACGSMAGAHGGRAIRELGDAVMAVFGGSGEACECAVAVIRNLKRYGRGIRTKVTVSSGTVWEVTSRRGLDVYGIPVNLCNRMSKYAVPDCVLITGADYCPVRDWLHTDGRLRYARVGRGGRDPVLADFGSTAMRRIIVG